MNRLDWLKSQMDKASHTRQIGWIGEQIVMELIPRERFIVYKPKHNHDGDVHITERSTGEIVRVEVKTSRVNHKKQFEFRLRKDDKHGQTSIDHADIVIFMCVWEGLLFFYLIPARLLPSKTVTIPIKDDRSKYQKYRLPSLQRLQLSEVCYA